MKQVISYNNTNKNTNNNKPPQLPKILTPNEKMQLIARMYSTDKRRQKRRNHKIKLDFMDSSLFKFY